MTEKPIKPTKEQIAAWKRDLGTIYHYKSADGKQCYFRRPTRRIIAAATVTAGNDNLLQKELVIKNCFLGGDPELTTEDKYLFALDEHIASTIEIVEGTLKEV